MAKKRKFKELKGYLKAKCDDCGNLRRLRWYDKQGNYVCQNCGPDKE